MEHGLPGAQGWHTVLSLLRSGKLEAIRHCWLSIERNVLVVKRVSNPDLSNVHVYNLP